MIKTFSREDVLDRVRDQNVKFIRLQFTSIPGFLKNIAVTVEELHTALKGRVMFDSSVIEGFVGSRESDIYLMPDPTTFVVFPWRPREGAVARLICDIASPDGNSFEGCPRLALKRVLEEYSAKELEVRVGAEIEFYLFHVDEHGRPTSSTQDQAGYCDLTPVDRGENARRDMVLTLQEMGFDVATSFHEIGPGQHEIYLKEDTVLSMADSITTFKFVVRTIAQRHGLHASFMPRPLGGCNGSGMNLHLSVFQKGLNAFDSPGDEYQLSSLAQSYMGGILDHAAAITAVANPTVNSYKRLMAGGTAPVLAAWSRQNRSTMIRVPAERGEGARIVIRSPDPSCNPYIALAACLRAGLDGVSRGLPAPEPLDDLPQGNGELRELVRRKGLPRNLEGALIALSRDRVIREALGERIYRRFTASKEDEWERYQSTVHSWEIEEYLTNY
ncbi:MAG: type I glutamate--ammonia ligase [Firmicutes bacterium]|nr:type I glutamate--ammonia ligase [Bacillota bacterium]MCL5056927.1 type I glutamate--ammonia ligase [Actinomycetota bacterium]